VKPEVSEAVEQLKNDCREQKRCKLSHALVRIEPLETLISALESQEAEKRRIQADILEWAADHGAFIEDSEWLKRRAKLIRSGELRVK
jgi:hypothetical protein